MRAELEVLPALFRAVAVGPSVPIVTNLETSDWSSVQLLWNAPVGSILTLTYHDAEGVSLGVRRYFATLAIPSPQPIRAPVLGPLLDVSIVATNTPIQLGLELSSNLVPEPETLLYSGDVSGLGNVSLDTSAWESLLIDYQASPPVGAGFFLTAIWDNADTTSQPVVIDWWNPGLGTVHRIVRPRQQIKVAGSAVRFQYTPSAGMGALAVQVFGSPRSSAHQVHHPGLTGTVISEINQTINAGLEIDDYWASGGFPAQMLVVIGTGAASGDFAIVLEHYTQGGVQERIWQTVPVIAAGTFFGPQSRDTFWVPPGVCRIRNINASAVNRLCIETLTATD